MKIQYNRVIDNLKLSLHQNIQCDRNNYSFKLSAFYSMVHSGRGGSNNYFQVIIFYNNKVAIKKIIIGASLSLYHIFSMYIVHLYQSAVLIR